MISVTNIYRHLIKSLSTEALSESYFRAGSSLKDDRRSAIALGSTNLDLGGGGWMAENYFLMQVKNPKLTQARKKYDPCIQTLTIFRGGKQVSSGQLTTIIGRTMVEYFLTAYMGDDAQGRLKVFETQKEKMLSDQSRPLISLINLASVRDIRQIMGVKTNSIRFSWNINFECSCPWLKSGWVGQTLWLGVASLKVVAPVGRCVVTHINPKTSKHGVNILKALQYNFSHTNCGIFAQVTQTGTIQINAKINII